MYGGCAVLTLQIIRVILNVHKTFIVCFTVVVFTAIADKSREPLTIVFLSNRTFAWLNKRLNFITQLSCYALSSDFVLLLWINHSFRNIWNFFLLVFLPTRAKRLVKTIDDVSISMQKIILPPRKGWLSRLPSCSHQRVSEQKILSKTLHKRLSRKNHCIFRDNPYAQTDWSFKNRSACDENIFPFSSLQSHLKIAVRLNGMRLLLLDCLYQLFAVSAFRSVGKHIFTSIPQKMFLIDIRRSKPNTSIRICHAAQTNQKELRLFQFVFLPLFIFGCFVCIGECTTIGIIRMDLLLSWSIYTKYVRFTGLVTFEIAIFSQNEQKTMFIFAN